MYKNGYISDRVILKMSLIQRLITPAMIDIFRDSFLGVTKGNPRDTNGLGFLN